MQEEEGLYGPRLTQGLNVGFVVDKRQIVKRIRRADVLLITDVGGSVFDF